MNASLRRFLPMYIFIFAIFLVVFAHLKILLPTLAPSLTFSFADLSSLIGPKSAALAIQKVLYPYDISGASYSLEYYRYGALPGALFLFASVFSFSEAWVWAMMSIIAMGIGIYGFYKLFPKELSKLSGAFAVSTLLLFYFLNYYAVGRVIHIYIWFGYLVTPYLISLAFDYARTGKKYTLIALAVIFSQFFVFPHGLVYGAALIALLSLFVAEKSVKKGVIFLLAGGIGYFVFNIQIFLSMLFPSAQYPIPANISMFELLSRNGSFYNSFSFVNNWWYIVDMSDTKYYQAIGIVLSLYIVLIILSLLLRFYIQKKWKLFGIFSIVLVTLGGLGIFASGMHSPLVATIVEFLANKHILGSFLVFREWGRILVLLPALYVIVSSYGYKEFDEEGVLGNAMRRFIPAMVVLFLVFSPFVFTLLWKAFDPVIFPKIYTQVQSEIPSESKVLWLSPKQRIEIYGMTRMIWNSNKTPDMVVKSIGSQYGNYGSVTLPIVNYLSNEPNSKELLSNLLINTIVIRNDYYAKEVPILQTSGVARPTSTNLLETIPILDTTINSRIDTAVNDYVNDPRVWNILAEHGIGTIPVGKEQLATNKITEINQPIDELLKRCSVQVSCKKNSVYPYSQLTRHLPESIWSRGTTAELVQEPFIYYLHQFNIATYFSDDGNGTAFTHMKSASMNIEVPRFPETNTYKVFAKVLFSQKSGQLQFSFDTTNIVKSTLSQTPHFTWIELGEYEGVSSRKVNLKVVNLAGFNAIQEIAFVKKSDWNQLVEALDNKGSNAVSVLYPGSTPSATEGVFNVYCDAGSVGLKIGTGLVNCDVPTQVVLKIGDTISLDKGLALFVGNKVTSKRQSTLLSLTRNSPVRLTGKLPSYTRGDVITIAETYDPAWQAYATDTQGKRIKLESVKAYDFMQGFTLLQDNYVSIEVTYANAEIITYIRLFSLIAPLFFILYWVVLYMNKDGNALKSSIETKSIG